jgi:ActR/RegA family two-component response regulator/DNA-binding MarR family transcriptional regulator
MNAVREGKGGMGGPVQVLLVDDDRDLLEELAEGLAFEGLPAMTALSAADAITLLARNHSLCYVVTDLMMPGIGGLELINKIATIKPLRDVVTVVMTGAATLESATIAIRYGVSDFLQKPVSAREVANALRRRGVDTADVEPRNASATRREILSAILDDRKDRTKLFGEFIATDPVWDMLLDLAYAKESNEAVSTTNLCIGAGVPITTGLRRLDELEKLGLVVRQPDPADRRRIMVTLTAIGEAQMQEFLERFSKRFITLRDH